ncbi:unnamed protein product [Linum tenue]|uniref:Uncharacterized protein n=1 Tax=Linum tenue TaxID=586396 RepID=A0AAV0R5W6_9ROSI|nr:unnamed protein product [Linum tenue]
MLASNCYTFPLRQHASCFWHLIWSQKPLDTMPSCFTHCIHRTHNKQGSVRLRMRNPPTNYVYIYIYIYMQFQLPECFRC